MRAANLPEGGGLGASRGLSCHESPSLIGSPPRPYIQTSFHVWHTLVGEVTEDNCPHCVSELDTNSAGWDRVSGGSDAAQTPPPPQRLSHCCPSGTATPTGKVGLGAEHRFHSTSSPLTLPKMRKLRPKAGHGFLGVPRLVSGKAGAPEYQASILCTQIGWRWEEGKKRKWDDLGHQWR